MNRFLIITLTLVSALTVPSVSRSETVTDQSQNPRQVRYQSTEVDGINVFYREAGPKDAPTLLLLHGFPTSSHMFRDLIPELADRYHIIAPDYPGFGHSDAPPVDSFDYTFDNLAGVVEKLTDQLELRRYSLYLMDYGAPVGFRLAAKYPERVETLIVQNGNAYDEGIANDFWNPVKKYWADRSDKNGDALRSLLTIDATKWQYTHGVRDVNRISPDTWDHVQPLLDRPGNQEIQLALFHSYGSNPPLYPQWQSYLRKHQPPMLIVWGKNDAIFPAEGAFPYQRDLRDVELHLIDTGHFALEEDGEVIASLMRTFLAKHVAAATCRVEAN